MKKILDWVAIILTVLAFVASLLFLFSLVMAGNINDVIIIGILVVVYTIVSLVVERAYKAIKEKTESK